MRHTLLDYVFLYFPVYGLGQDYTGGPRPMANTAHTQGNREIHSLTHPSNADSILGKKKRSLLLSSAPSHKQHVNIFGFFRRFGI
jgi:hypothetical protein